MYLLIEKIKGEIARYDKPENRIDYQRFFKEKLDHPIGLKTAIIRKISNSCFKEIKSKPVSEILDICDELLASGERYTTFLAFDWALKIKNEFRKSDFPRFERWLGDYIDNWASCDNLGGITGEMLLLYPDLAAKTKKWAKSKNRWFRRAAAVSLIAPAKKGVMLDQVFKTADLLLTDDDDLVQKGYGWMLKEAADKFPDEVFEYLMKHRSAMSRTALRYSIEKFPADRRRKVMEK